MKTTRKFVNKKLYRLQKKLRPCVHAFDSLEKDAGIIGVFKREAATRTIMRILLILEEITEISDKVLDRNACERVERNMSMNGVEQGATFLSHRRRLCWRSRLLVDASRSNAQGEHL